MPKAIDMHVHLPTGSFLNGAIKPFRLAAEKFFRSTVRECEMDEVARMYEEMDIVGVLLAWDAETATGLPPLTN
ncbi:MAG TPA: amidohydrolase, partial [Blastocatellia bacterium]